MILRCRVSENGHVPGTRGAGSRRGSPDPAATPWHGRETGHNRGVLETGHNGPEAGPTRRNAVARSGDRPQQGRLSIPTAATAATVAAAGSSTAEGASAAALTLLQHTEELLAASRIAEHAAARREAPTRHKA